MKSLLRAVGRLLFFPLILAVGCFVGVIAIVTHPRQVMSRLRHQGLRTFEAFTPEERKVILHIILGFAALAVLIAAIVIGIRAMG